MKPPYEVEQTSRKSSANWQRPTALAQTAVAAAPPRSLGIGRAIRNESFRVCVNSSAHCGRAVA